MTAPIVKRYGPTVKRRRSGYVTQALIDKHGSYAKALAWLYGEVA